MHPRYPAEHASTIFSDQERLNRWSRIAAAYYIDHGVPAPEDGFTVSAEAVATREQRTGHDVAAFLSLLEDRLGENATYLHRGLTSSDLVDAAHFWSLRQHALVMADLVSGLRDALNGLPYVIRPGRTHGQKAAWTYLGHQAAVRADALSGLSRELYQFTGTETYKSPGPTGVSEVCEPLGLQMLGWKREGGTQIMHRDRQAQWASLYVRVACVVEDVAQWVRDGSHSDVAELMEGGAVRRQGSSAMPHKRNPIGSEQLCGLARVARGYANPIYDTVATWGDRDISNSSVERTVVPDLAAVVEYMVLSMTRIVRDLRFDEDRMRDEVIHSWSCWSHEAQTITQRVLNVGPVEASHVVASIYPENARRTDAFDVCRTEWLNAIERYAGAEAAHEAIKLMADARDKVGISSP